MKYICDICGYKTELYENTSEAKELCPVCKKGALVSEKKLLENEQMEQMIEDNKDDNMTPKQDAEEVIDDYIVARMKNNIKTQGNDKIWFAIENCLINADQRAKYRKFFFLAGGDAPYIQTIRVKGDNITLVI